MSEINRYVIVSHHPCQDGFMAATICMDALITIGGVPRDRIEWIAGDYSKATVLPTSKDTMLYVLDFSYEPDVMVWLADGVHTLVWIDHHRTAIDAWKQSGRDRPNICAFLSEDNGASGAMLTWQHFHPDEPAPPAVVAVDDRDRWQFKHLYTKELTAFGFSLPYTFTAFREWLYATPAEIQEEVAAGTALMRKTSKDAVALVDAMVRFRTAAGVEFATLNCPFFLVSETSEHLLRQYSFLDYVMCFWLGSELVHFSLRSSIYFDVSEIAKQYGGGGHKGAAGFTMQYAQARAEFPYLWESR